MLFGCEHEEFSAALPPDCLGKRDCSHVNFAIALCSRWFLSHSASCLSIVLRCSHGVPGGVSTDISGLSEQSVVCHSFSESVNLFVNCLGLPAPPLANMNVLLPSNFTSPTFQGTCSHVSSICGTAGLKNYARIDTKALCQYLCT